MSKTFSPKKGKTASTEPLSPLLTLLGKLEDVLDAEENQHLLDDIVRFFPDIPQSEPRSACCMSVPGSEPAPVPIAATLTGSADFSLLQEAFAAFQERFPLRAAGYYLCCLVRIRMVLEADSRLDLIQDDDAFAQAYLDALLQVQAIVVRCERCVKNDADQGR